MTKPNETPAAFEEIPDADECTYCGHERSHHSKSDGPCEECAAMPKDTTAYQKAWHSFDELDEDQGMVTSSAALPWTDLEIRIHLRDAHDLAHSFRYTDADVETVTMRRWLSCTTCQAIARDVLLIAPWICSQCARGEHDLCLDCDCKTLPMPQHPTADAARRARRCTEESMSDTYDLHNAAHNYVDTVNGHEIYRASDGIRVHLWTAGTGWWGFDLREDDARHICKSVENPNAREDPRKERT